MEDRYIKISIDIAQSAELSLEEKGLLLYLLSSRVDFKIIKTELPSVLNIGRDKFNKIWRSLVEKKYIEIKKSKDKGKFVYHYTIKEIK
jgi:hypothetical protein